MRDGCDEMGWDGVGWHGNMGRDAREEGHWKRVIKREIRAKRSSLMPRIILKIFGLTFDSSGIMMSIGSVEPKSRKNHVDTYLSARARAAQGVRAARVSVCRGRPWRVVYPQRRGTCARSRPYP